MKQLGRYPLSVILSFLTETEGTSLLITAKKYATVLLPQFRIRNGMRVVGSKQRHEFRVFPVQDPTALLSRLNTRKLRRWRDYPVHQSTLQLVQTPENLAVDPRHRLLQFQRQSDTITLLVSYPRSGNTLLRNLLERVTGKVTGSDTRPDRPLSQALAQNLVGEGCCQCDFVKTHWPERIGFQEFRAERAVLVVRNPLHAMDSLWNLNATCSHTETVTDEVYGRFRDKYRRLIQNEIKVWLRFHEFWFHKQQDIPVMIVRFEDLLHDTKHQLERIFEFSNTPVSKDMVERAANGSKQRMGSYRPRQSSREKHLTPDLVEYIHKTCGDFSHNYLKMFGYLPDSKIDLTPHDPTEGTQGSMVVNRGILIRSRDCEFGRLMQKWRHSVTDCDTNPLPIVKRL